MLSRYWRCPHCDAVYTLESTPATCLKCKGPINLPELIEIELTDPKLKKLIFEVAPICVSLIIGVIIWAVIREYFPVFSYVIEVLGNVGFLFLGFFSLVLLILVWHLLKRIWFKLNRQHSHH